MPIRMTHPNLDGHIDVQTERAAAVHERSGWQRQKPHACPDCDRAFDSPQGLASHSRTHNDAPDTSNEEE